MIIYKSDRGPLIHIHKIDRHVHGNGIDIKVWAEIKVAGKDIIYAREVYLNTIEVVQLTPMSGDHYGPIPQKWVYNKGEYDNYASIDIFCPDNVYEMTAGTRVGPIACPSSLPDDGSIWLDAIFEGE